MRNTVAAILDGFAAQA